MADLTYEPNLTGLISVDPYNDFLSEGEKLYDLSPDIIGGPETFSGRIVP